MQKPFLMKTATSVVARVPIVPIMPKQKYNNILKNTELAIKKSSFVFIS